MDGQPTNTAAPASTGATPAATPATETSTGTTAAPEQGAVQNSTMIENNRQASSNVNNAEGQAEQSSNQEKSVEEPKDLSEAYAMINADARTRATDSIPKTDSNEENREGSSNIPNGETFGNQTQQAGDRQPANANGVQTEQQRLSEQTANQDYGNFTDQQYAAQYEQYGRQLTEQIKQRAANDASAELNKRGVRKWTWQDIEESDEQGVRWKNPTQLNEYFSTMTEAENFLNAMNRRVQNEYDNIMNEKIADYKKRATPAMELEKFRGTYNKLDDQTKYVCGVLSQPYAIYGQDGKTPIGFNCDLNAVAQQASAIVQGMKQQQQTQQQPTQQGTVATQPPLDANTANAVPSKEKTPDDLKDLSEAMEYVIEQRQKNKK